MHVRQLRVVGRNAVWTTGRLGRFARRLAAKADVRARSGLSDRATRLPRLRCDFARSDFVFEMVGIEAVQTPSGCFGLRIHEERERRGRRSWKRPVVRE